MEGGTYGSLSMSWVGSVSSRTISWTSQLRRQTYRIVGLDGLAWQVRLRRRVRHDGDSQLGVNRSPFPGNVMMLRFEAFGRSSKFLVPQANRRFNCNLSATHVAWVKPQSIPHHLHIPDASSAFNPQSCTHMASVSNSQQLYSINDWGRVTSQECLPRRHRNHRSPGGLL